MIELVVSELGRNKLRSVLTIVGIAIGILLVISLSSFSKGVEYSINEELKYMSGLITVVQKGVGFQNYMHSKIDESIVEEIEDMLGVEEVAPIIFYYAHGFGTVMGFDPDHFDMFSGIEVGMKEGRIIEKDEYEITLGSKLAEKLKLNVGDYVNINGVKLEVVGIFKETGTEDDNAAFTSFSILRDISGMEDEVSMIMIKPESVDEAKGIAEDINELSDDVFALTDEDIRRYAKKLTGQLNILTFVIGGVAAFIAGIVIMNVMIMSVRERRREIGIMKAVGASNMQVLGEIITESITISLIGAAIGIVMAFIAVRALNAIIGSAIALITPDLLLESIIFATAIGLTAGIFPAKQAANLDPVVAIRYE
mgnify:CR=1 FL=1